jgi:hypothetical protein
MVLKISQEDNAGAQSCYLAYGELNVLAVRQAAFDGHHIELHHADVWAMAA